MTKEELLKRVMRLSPSERLILAGQLIGRDISMVEVAVALARDVCDELDAEQILARRAGRAQL